jgi:hypothetical protein
LVFVFFDLSKKRSERSTSAFYHFLRSWKDNFKRYFGLFFFFAHRFSPLVATNLLINNSVQLAFCACAKNIERMRPVAKVGVVAQKSEEPDADS